MPSATIASRPFERELPIVRRFPIGIAVFIIFALAANIAETCQLNSGPNSHSTPFATRMPKPNLDYTGQASQQDEGWPLVWNPG